MIDRSEPQWYRDAIIYQLHIKSFFDSDNTGIGDFAGATEKLDYIKDLGVTAIWVMPFYPSPLRDDGYDISDYRNINPAYGTMKDFKRFVKEAHARGIRVITELVINHTSDQHPWFQKARLAKPGSAARDFYVWSDTDQKYQDTRIIFLDTEPSNWSWDPVAKAYYWHRFFSHQPDLNFDNPKVLEAVLDVMRFWLDMGVDGLRLDAIPYLIEREGTNCENLPETHTILKKIRATLDAEYPDRMLLAEANQWPEDTAPYFGDGDECHMAFHFPLMPRMYMGIAQEDRHPITDIMRQTPEIPDSSQWAIFLRNHDELTLEMVTDQERDYLWSFYANDTRARINMGIRRRLAPLLENDRRKIELLNSLLLSMPGTPILYYGDEIGMGDNIYLGDRDGVRTPMQWSPDRNGGFSRADPAKLYLPAIQDPIYGYEAVNVEAEYRSPSSLLNWLRRLIAVRRGTRAFGRGTLRFLYPANRKVLAYVRSYEEETFLCVANLSRAPQAVELDLSDFRGNIPTEMTGGTAFPAIGDLPYLLTLPAYGFFWLNLSAAPQEEDRFGPRFTPELFTLVLQGSPQSLLTGRERKALETNVAPPFLSHQRWFAAKSAKLNGVSLADHAIMKDREGRESFPLALLSANLADGRSQDYFVPVAVEEAENEALLPYALAKMRKGRSIGLLVDASIAPEFPASVVAAMERGDILETAEGARLKFHSTNRLSDALTPPAGAELDLTPERFSGEQSNSSVVLGSQMVLKLYRRLQPGTHPEIEVGRFLTEVADYGNIPPLLGYLEHVGSDGTSTAMAVLQGYVRNQGDAWGWLLDGLKRELELVALSAEGEQITMADRSAPHAHYTALLGRRTAELHLAFATPTDDPAFEAEPFGKNDLKEAVEDAKRQAERAFSAAGSLAEASEFMDRKPEILKLIDRLSKTRAAGIKTRIHGDYHLGQVLIAQDDVVLVDFEGEPSRPADERRMKASPLRDVAGMLRSFAYAADAAAKDVAARFGDNAERVHAAAEEWRQLTVSSFSDAYEAVARGQPIWIEDDSNRHALLRLYLLTKALYETAYEANARPDWIATPLRGVLQMLDDKEA
ncbi:trehalose synthase [Agaricicola taiwanensis]|uniref:Maltokinase n=1 Tax=Agaricicola taiwanensis TaxID=591372 RepID=A0A8J2YEG3_9RHOB|nr:maltose alpha-D-glucosyltransferase [Agaricicola taiwanensis]GGE36699.1 trehalose synthase [Agaricicola taiwanensis]